MSWRCRILGHDWRFTAQDRTLRWSCRRCGAVGGTRAYEDAARAARIMRALEGERAREGRPFLLSALPLWLIRRIRRGS